MISVLGYRNISINPFLKPLSIKKSYTTSIKCQLIFCCFGKFNELVMSSVSYKSNKNSYQ